MAQDDLWDPNETPASPLASSMGPSIPAASPLATAAPAPQPKRTASKATSGPSGAYVAQSQLQSDRDMESQRAKAIQDQLQGRYSAYGSSVSSVKDILDKATQQLTNTPVGPTSSERWNSMIAGLASAPGLAGLGAMSGAAANTDAQARQQQLEKQALLAKYGLESGQMGMQAAQMGIQQLNSQENNAQNRLTGLDTAISNANKPNSQVIVNPATGQLEANHALIDAQAQSAAAKTAASTKARQDILGGYVTPEAVNYAADIYRTTGQLPVGMARSNPTFAPQVIALAAQKAAEEGNNAQADLYNRAAYKASQSSMTQLTKQQTMVGAFEQTAEKNLQLALQESEKVDRTGSPLINKAVMAWKQGVAGDPETSGFVNALTTFKNEYAKVLSGATGAQGITDSARREADDLFSKVQSKESLQYVANIARQEMHNRMSSFQDQQRILQAHMLHPDGQKEVADEPPATGSNKPTDKDIAYLKAHPETAAKFKAHFGSLPEGVSG